MQPLYHDMSKKLIITVLLLLVLFAACKKNEMPVSQAQDQAENQVPQTKEFSIIPDVTVEISGKSFQPSNVEMRSSQTITWLNRNEKPHFVACYENTQRVFLSDKILSGEDFSTRFTKPGRYFCIETIYGAKMNISVV